MKKLLFAALMFVAILAQAEVPKMPFTIEPQIPRKINVDPSVFCSCYSFLRTGMHTFLTVETVVTVVHDLHSGELGLRIGTPFAAKGAPLQDNRGPDARPVVNRKLLYIKDDSFRFHT